MKTAIILSGAMRSFERCRPNLEWQVFRHFPEAKFFICTADDEDADKAYLQLGAEVRKVTQPEMVAPAGCPDSWIGGVPYMHEPYFISVPPQAVLGQLWMLRQAWDMYKESGYDADLVIRCRPDLWFHVFDKPQYLARLVKDGFHRHSAWTPRFGKFGGCNDRFALLGPDAAEAYFTTYDQIPAMISEGAPLHPETLVKYSMERKGVTVLDNMRADFSTLRKSGEMRPPEITPSDILDCIGRV